MKYLVSIFLLGFLCHPTWAQEQSIVEAGQWNVFVDDQQAQSHLLHRPKGRTIFAFPAENSGLAIWYSGELRYREGSFQSIPVSQGQAVKASFEVLQDTEIQSLVLDSIRAIRDHDSGEPIAQRLKQARRQYAQEHQVEGNWVEPVFQGESKEISVERLQFSVGAYRMIFQGSSVTRRGATLSLQQGSLTIEAYCPFPKQEKLPLSELLHPAYLPEIDSLSRREKTSLQALNFLTTEEKMMAGSWRFLTYFGRDTLISLSMLEPILSDRGLLNGVESVLTRLSPEGAVAHEEDIGSWAEWRHLEKNPPSFSLDPVYDYKMIDDDLLLPVLLHKLEQDGRSEVWKSLFGRSESRAAIGKNADYVLKKLSTRTPLLLLPGEATGEWRDSDNGLGGGVDPYSVNGALTVSAARALDAIYTALEQPAKAKQARALTADYQKIAERFWVTLSAEEVASRLKDATQHLPQEQRSAFTKSIKLEGLNGSFTFPILSFSTAQKANAVSHTDVAFNLFYDSLSPSDLDRILSFLEQPFPLGVITEVGPVVANPYLSADPKLYKELGLGQYHGVVVWSWQSAMLQFGLLRQAQLHPDQRDRILVLVEVLAAGEERVGELANSELWGVTLSEGKIGARGYGTGGDQAESNAMQLWSTVYPALRFVKRSI